MKKLFTLAAVLKQENRSGFEIGLSQGYRFTETEDEAIGSFVANCLETRPGFALMQVIALEVRPEEVAKVAAEQSANVA
jgi:hypothetical protein